ncbi:MAG: hypothetical protein V8S77_02110 [Oscillospiraceae bacterium]
MDELKAALTQRAIELHTQRVRDSLCAHEGNDSRYSSYGMGLKSLPRKSRRPAGSIWRANSQGHIKAMF